jgi:hypothetical protein
MTPPEMYAVPHKPTFETLSSYAASDIAKILSERGLR